MPAATRMAPTARCASTPRCCKKIQSDYVTDPNMGDVTTGALHGLLESLDADSSYLTPARVQDLQGAPHHGRRADRHDRFEALSDTRRW